MPRKYNTVVDEYEPMFKEIEAVLDKLKESGCRKDRVWLALLHYQKQWKPEYPLGMRDGEIAKHEYER